MPATASALLPSGYGYVILSIIEFGLINAWQAQMVNGARKAAGIPYPNPYASREVAEKDRKAHIFNCTVRAHANTLEQMPWVLPLTTVSGLVFPRLTAGFTALFGLGKIVYTLGYITGEPAKRNRGLFGYIGLLGLLGTSIMAAVTLLQ